MTLERRDIMLTFQSYQRHVNLIHGRRFVFGVDRSGLYWIIQIGWFNRILYAYDFSYKKDFQRQVVEILDGLDPSSEYGQNVLTYDDIEYGRYDKRLRDLLGLRVITFMEIISLPK